MKSGLYQIELNYLLLLNKEMLAVDIYSYTFKSVIFKSVKIESVKIESVGVDAHQKNQTSNNSNPQTQSNPPKIPNFGVLNRGSDPTLPK